MTTKHSWRLDSEGGIDLWALAFEFCNGPYCETCMESFCVNCTPEWATTICVGDDDEQS